MRDAYDPRRTSPAVRRTSLVERWTFHASSLTLDALQATHRRAVRAGEAGAAAVEFALVVPLLALLLIGMIEFGVVLHRQGVVATASREGARAGIIQTTPKPTTGAIERVVRNFLAGAGWNPGEAQVIVVGAGGQSGSDLAVRVESRYRFLFLSNFVPGLGNAFTLRSQTIMKHE